MNRLFRFTWPPSPDALGSPPPDDDAPTEPRRIVRMHHRVVAVLLRRLALATEPPAVSHSASEDQHRWRRRLGRTLGELSAFIENHRDFEESVLFPMLLAGADFLGPTLDDLSDDHIRIFDEMRRLNLLLDRLDLEPHLGVAERRALLPTLRSFVEGLWRHTLAEEAMLAELRGRHG